MFPRGKLVLLLLEQGDDSIYNGSDSAINLWIWISACEKTRAVNLTRVLFYSLPSAPKIMGSYPVFLQHMLKIQQNHFPWFLSHPARWWLPFVVIPAGKLKSRQEKTPPPEIRRGPSFTVKECCLKTREFSCTFRGLYLHSLPQRQHVLPE